MFKNLKISTRLTSVIAAIVLLSVITTNYYSYFVAKRQIRQEVQNSLEFHSRLEKDHVMDHFVERAKRRAIDFSSDGLIRENVEQVRKDTQFSGLDLNQHLSLNKQPLDQYIYGINIFNMGKQIIASTHEREIGKVEKGDTYVTFSLNAKYGDSYVSDIDIYENHFEKTLPLIVASAPLYNSQRTKNLGVIAVYFRADWLAEVLTVSSGDRHQQQKQTLGQNIDTYIVNKEGFLITPSILTPGKILEKKIDTLPVRECRDGREVNDVYKNTDGITVVGSSRCLPGGWTMVLEIDQEKAFAPIAAVRNKILLSSFFISFASFIIVYLFSRSVTSPIKKLLNFTKKVGEGDLSPEIHLKSMDEIGLLGESLNEMAKKLRSAREDLESEVETRTKELKEMKIKVEQANKHLEKEVQQAKGEMEDLKELQKTSEMFKVSVESMLDGFAILSAIREDGKIEDFRYEYINEAGAKLYLSTSAKILGRTLLELLPNHKPSGLFEKYVKVVETGQPYTNDSIEYEDYYNKEKLKRTFEVRAVKLGDGFAATWRDISQNKKQDVQIEEQLKQLEEFKDLTVGRELKMIELKNKINKLKKELETA